MKTLLIISLILSTQTHFSSLKSTTEEVPINERIQVLKEQLKQEIDKSNTLSDLYSDMYEYVDTEHLPLTPIAENDKRKLQDRFKLPEIKSTTTEKYEASDTSDDLELKPIKSYKRSHKKHKSSKPKDIFYRRNDDEDLYLHLNDEEERKKPQKWTHCIDLMTPYLRGYKNDYNMTHVRGPDGIVVRLAQLLTTNTTHYTKEEMRSILYQISNIHIRLFQWDHTAITTLFNVIIMEKSHNFRTLKRGLKNLFTSWGLNITDTEIFLDQSRIFRPPCIQVSLFEGSTLTPKGLRYSTLKTTKHVHREGDDDDEDCSDDRKI